MKRIILQSIQRMMIFGIAAAALGLCVNLIHPYGIDQIVSSSPPTVDDESVVPADTLSLSMARRFHDESGAIFVDARRSRRFKAGHIPGAVSLPWTRFERFYNDTILLLVSRPAIIVYGENARDSHAVELARKLVGDGYLKVYHYSGGFEQWKRLGLPLEHLG